MTISPRQSLFTPPRRELIARVAAAGLRRANQAYTLHFMAILNGQLTLPGAGTYLPPRSPANDI